MSDDNRKGRGKAKNGVLFPVPPKTNELPDSYSVMRDTIIAQIKESRVRVVVRANSEMIMLYWNIGNVILERQSAEGWGAKVIDRLAADLQKRFPEMSRFSPRNLKNMRKFAECWTDREIVQQVVAQIPWRSNIILLDKIRDASDRLWYACQTIENGWSSNVLDMVVKARKCEAVNITGLNAEIEEGVK